MSDNLVKRLKEINPHVKSVEYDADTGRLEIFDDLGSVTATLEPAKDNSECIDDRIVEIYRRMSK